MACGGGRGVAAWASSGVLMDGGFEFTGLVTRGSGVAGTAGTLCMDGTSGLVQSEAVGVGGGPGTRSVGQEGCIGSLCGTVVGGGGGGDGGGGGGVSCTDGEYRRRNFLFHSVSLPEPSTLWWNWRTCTTSPVRSHRVGCGPYWFCSRTWSPTQLGEGERVFIPSCLPGG